MTKRIPIVIKISGSYIQPDNPELILKYKETLEKIWNEGRYRPIVIVGGGKKAREYIQAARKLGAHESLLDNIGIEVTRLNAMLLLSALGDKALYHIPKTHEEIMIASQDPLDRIIVLGGLQPGQSTNAVSAVTAEIVGAKKIINATKVEGVYDKDPIKHPDAKLIKKLSIRELKEILSGQSSMAGKYDLLDQPSITIIERSKITVHIIKGDDPNNIIRVLEGEEIGSSIIP